MNEIQLKESGKTNVVVGFSGRISRDNAPDCEKELRQIRADHPQGTLTLDFEKLEYISSAGLRMLLTIAKEEKEKVRVFQISSEIFEILEDTGFVKMFEAHKAMKRYSLEGCEMIGQGANGQVFRMDKENIVKVFQKSTPLEDIDRERNLAQQALLDGIPTAISYTVVVVDEDRYGIVFELIDADPLSQVLKNNPDTYEKNTDQYIHLYKKIHETEGDPTAFGSIKDIYYDSINACKDYYSEAELQKLHDLVASVPDRKTLIHGDYHPNNVMWQNGDLILIDMGDMSIGHPIFDFLATAATQVNLVKLSPEYAEFHTKMPAELITKTWRKLIDQYFGDKTKEERDRIEEQICIFSKLKVALAPVFGRGAAPEIIQASIDDAKQNFLPKIDELIGAVDW